MALATLAAAKAFRNIVGTQHDSELLRLIDMASAFIERFCGRKLEQATITEHHSTRAGQARLYVRNPPVASITSMHDDPQRLYGASTLLSNNTDYVLERADAGIVAFLAHKLVDGVNNVQVVYVGGFAPVPADVAQATIELVWLARDLGDKALLGVQSKSFADGSITVFQRNRLDAVRDILDRYTLRRL